MDAVSPNYPRDYRVMLSRDDDDDDGSSALFGAEKIVT